MVSASFEEFFGFPPESSAQAPGRVNLLGEHTDYNDGFVLPIAIPRYTTVEVAPSWDAEHHFFAAEFNLKVSCRPDRPPAKGFGTYVYGCLRLLADAGFPVPPVSLRISSNVPMGAGLSSSAALEVAVLRALRQWLQLELDDVRIAQLAQQAEIIYAHVNCGIMDQMAASLADERHMLFLDTRSLARELLPLPGECELLVLDSGVPRSLAASGYNARRRECEEAARLLGVVALRDVTDPTATDALPAPLAQRARHVVSENGRVLEAVQGVSAEHFGDLMNLSHTSLRDDFAVSVAALDALVDLLQAHPAVFGARLTGAGFGGACIALTRKSFAGEVARDVLPRYQQQGHNGAVLVEP